MSRLPLLAALLAAVALMLVSPPLQAEAAVSSACVVATGDANACSTTIIMGHRCRDWGTDNAHTNENTVAALRYVAENSPGAGCEIDIWRLHDGGIVVQHDPTWTRTIDPATMVGVSPNVVDATSAQVARMRTKGGQPVPTLQQMIVASGQNHVPLLIETKNYTVDPSWVTFARQQGVTAWWYHSPSPTHACWTVMLDRIRPTGAVVGMKGTRSCDYLSPAQVRQQGTFLVTNVQTWTKAQVQTYRNLGVMLSPYLVQPEGLANIVSKGARMVIVPDTAVAAAWFGR